MAEVFISYSHSDVDREWVRRFAEALRKEDVSVWLDEERIGVGDSIRDALEEGLRSSDAVVAVITPDNLNKPSLLFDMGAATGMDKRVIPIVSKEVEDKPIPFDLRTRRFLIQRSPEESAEAVVSALSRSAKAENVP